MGRRRTDPDDVTRDGVEGSPPDRDPPPPPPPDRDPPPPPPPDRDPPIDPPPDRDPPIDPFDPRRELPRDLPRDEIVPDAPTSTQLGRPQDRPDDDSPEQAPVAAPRPPGGFPRAIAHDEQVEYSYDPDTDEFQARIVDSSEPVVTRWDDSAPAHEERPGGTFAVTPSFEGVTAEHTGRTTIPEGVKDQLKEEAEETGERATSVSRLRYQHDLDTGETEYRPPRRSPAELAAIIQRRNQQRDNGSPPSELSAKYQMVAKHLERQAREQKAQRQQRASRRRSGECRTR